jgi:predicted small secreted protein
MTLFLLGVVVGVALGIVAMIYILSRPWRGLLR